MILRVALPLILLAFTVYTAVDAIQAASGSVRNLPKGLWILLIVFFTPVGGIAWFLAGRPPTRGPGAGRPLPGRPLGPDDDPDFLRGL